MGDGDKLSPTHKGDFIMPTPRTEWIQLEPPGFGEPQPFGDVSYGDPGWDGPIQIHSRGFGDPSTHWKEAEAV